MWMPALGRMFQEIKMEKSKQGHVYILESDNCDCIKIGGTDFPPAKRLREINKTDKHYDEFEILVNKLNCFYRK